MNTVLAYADDSQVQSVPADSSIATYDQRFRSDGNFLYDLYAIEPRWGQEILESFPRFRCRRLYPLFLPQAIINCLLVHSPRVHIVNYGFRVKTRLPQSNNHVERVLVDVPRDFSLFTTFRSVLPVDIHRINPQAQNPTFL